MGDIELDDYQVVEVTGKAYRDKQRRPRKNKCECNPSLRATTIIIFVCIGIVYIAGVALGNVMMFNSLEYLDQGSSNSSINRLTMLIEDDVIKLKQLVNVFAMTPLTQGAVEAILMDPTVVDNERGLNGLASFIGTFINTTTVVDEQMNPVYDEYGRPVTMFGTSSEVNYWAILDANFNTLWAIYHPQVPGEAALAGLARKYPSPVFLPERLLRAVEKSGRPANDLAGWTMVLTPDTGSSEPMIMSLDIIPNFTAGFPFVTQVAGYLIGGRCVGPRVKLFSDDVPSCITMQTDDSDEEKAKWDEVDMEMFDKVEAGSFGVNKSYAGVPAFTKRENATMAKARGRICPSVPLFNATSSLMVGYMKLCGEDPKVYGYNKSSCFLMRLDRPMSMVDQGTAPVISLSAEIIAMMIFLCVVFVFFLDFVVLRRIVNLSNVIRRQTKDHANALKDEDEGTATSSVKDDNTQKRGKAGKSGKSGKSGRSASGTSENSRTTTSSDGGGEHRASARDEIGNLKRAMEQNAQGLRKRLESVNDNIKVEQQKTIRHKKAMQLLNLWCGRKDYFPGLRPNAVQLRYEPNRNLDDLLANPLAIEYLKSHCESDRTLENLWFILDVSWLEELETAEDNEENAEKRAQIHDVAVCAAKTILQRYIAVNAPQQINISAGTYKKLREKGDHYARHMFEEAVSEVKLMLNTDILPRFQKSAAYSAMSETLFYDSAGGDDEPEFSDETVSTAGSILTDEADEGEDGVTHVFAHTFKGLHQAFEVGHDDNSSTYSASSSHATTSGAVPSASLVAGTATTTTAQGEKGTAHTSTKDGTSVSGSSVSDSEEPPKMEDDKKKKEEPKKEEPKKEEAKKGSEESSDSSDSSSHSISSDSMSSSSAGSSSSD